MTRGRASLAIVAMRLQKESRIVLLALAACALLAYLQRYDDALVRSAGSLVFGTLIAIATSLLQRGSGRHRELELCEQSAPLYGRQLARATALVPCIVVTAALGGYWLVASMYASPNPADIGLTFAASYAAALVAISATVRTGFVRALYIVLACCVSGAVFELMQNFPVFALLFCIACGFVALRQYGEALARYDPV